MKTLGSRVAVKDMQKSLSFKNLTWNILFIALIFQRFAEKFENWPLTLSFDGFKFLLKKI